MKKASELKTPVGYTPRCTACDWVGLTFKAQADAERVDNWSHDCPLADLSNQRHLIEVVASRNLIAPRAPAVAYLVKTRLLGDVYLHPGCFRSSGDVGTPMTSVPTGTTCAWCIDSAGFPKVIR